MGIFRKASELEKLPTSISDALFDNNEIRIADEFESLIKEASSVNNKSVYENRLKSFREAQGKVVEWEKPEPARYEDLPGGIRRAGYGQRFSGEHSEMFGSEQIRSISFDNNKYAESLLNNGFSIWEPEFDELQDAFDESQRQSNAIFDRRTAAEKKAIAHRNWEQEQSSQIRKSNVLPYRGLGVSRLANEMPIHHGNFNSVGDFYAEAQDSIRNMSKTANSERKSGIQRKGVDPNERREQWENKEAIAARTMKSLESSSLLVRMAEGLDIE
jgi:hypothetical protein